MTSSSFDWLSKCKVCDLHVAELDPYDNPDTDSGYGAGDHSTAFEPLRRENAEVCLKALNSIKTRTSTILEVGSAQGFFLEAASSRGYKCVGLEPNRGLYQASIDKGNNVIQGFFPNDLPAETQYDCIAFNDVFEHVPDARATMLNCHMHLKDNGVLLINIPMRDGMFYRLGEIVKLFGWKTPLERLWQVGSMSPHLYYFDRENLSNLAAQCGFKLVRQSRLKTLTIAGLWKRLRVASNFSLPAAVLIWVATAALSPLLSILPADAKVFLFEAQPKS